MKIESDQTSSQATKCGVMGCMAMVEYHEHEAVYTENTKTLSLVVQLIAFASKGDNKQNGNRYKTKMRVMKILISSYWVVSPDHCLEIVSGAL